MIFFAYLLIGQRGPECYHGTPSAGNGGHKKPRLRRRIHIGKMDPGHEHSAMQYMTVCKRYVVARRGDLGGDEGGRFPPMFEVGGTEYLISPPIFQSVSYRMSMLRLH